MDSSIAGDEAVSRTSVSSSFWLGSRQSSAQQAGLATRGFRPGPLSRREAAVAWFAARIRGDLAETA